MFVCDINGTLCELLPTINRLFDSRSLTGTNGMELIQRHTKNYSTKILLLETKVLEECDELFTTVQDSNSFLKLTVTITNPKQVSA